MSAVIDVRRLDRVNWDFPQAGTPAGSIHTLHWFPGNFIPQIPAALIQVLSQPGDLVLDPFSGSGTTAVEAVRLGRRAILSDRLSPCIFIARAKLALLQSGIEKRQREGIISTLTFDHECKTRRLGNAGEGGNSELLTWYTPDTLAQLRYLWMLIEAERAPLQPVLAAIFSDILFDCASTRGGNTSTGKTRRHHWGWVADNVRPPSPSSTMLSLCSGTGSQCWTFGRATAKSCIPSANRDRLLPFSRTHGEWPWLIQLSISWLHRRPISA